MASITSQFLKSNTYNLLQYKSIYTVLFHFTMAAEAPPQIQYRDLMAECQQLMSKIASIEGDRNEHVLVEETLQPLDGGRRAYRLVGDVLVERTVAEVLPSIIQSKDNLNATIQALGDRLSIRQKKAAELKSKHNLEQ